MNTWILGAITFFLACIGLNPSKSVPMVQACSCKATWTPPPSSSLSVPCSATNGATWIQVSYKDPVNSPVAGACSEPNTHGKCLAVSACSLALPEVTIKIFDCETAQRVYGEVDGYNGGARQRIAHGDKFDMSMPACECRDSSSTLGAMECKKEIKLYDANGNLKTTVEFKLKCEPCKS